MRENYVQERGFEQYLEDEAHEDRSNGDQRVTDFASNVEHTVKARNYLRSSAGNVSLLGSVPVQSRVDALSSMFHGADHDGNGIITPEEYIAAGDLSRFEKVGGVYKSVVSANPHLSPAQQAKAASLFEFTNLDTDGDGTITIAELTSKFDRAGWLQLNVWDVGAPLAQHRLPNLVTLLVEHSHDVQEEENRCKASTSSTVTAQEADLSSSDAAAVDAHLSKNTLAAVDSPEESDSTWAKRMAVWAKANGIDAAAEDFLRPYVPTTNDANQSLSMVRLSMGKKKLSTGDQDQFNTDTFESSMKVFVALFSTTFCWRNTYDRGVGRPASCNSNHQGRAAMCYSSCQEYGSDYFRGDDDIEYCQKRCPGGTTDIGLYCRTDGNTRSKHCCGGCWPGNWCCRTWCCGDCGAGWTNTGCFCEPSWQDQDRKYSPGKTKYDRSVVGCDNGEDGPIHTVVGYYCYPPPRSGYSCGLTDCQQKCPSHMVQCGIGACALDSVACQAGEPANTSLQIPIRSLC